MLHLGSGHAPVAVQVPRLKAAEPGTPVPEGSFAEVCLGQLLASNAPVAVAIEPEETTLPCQLARADDPVAIEVQLPESLLEVVSAIRSRRALGLLSQHDTIAIGVRLLEAAERSRVGLSELHLAVAITIRAFEEASAQRIAG